MQSVNFYLDEYRPKPLSFDHRFALFVVGLSLLGMLTIGWIQSQQVDTLAQQINDTKKFQETLQEQIKSIEAKLAQDTEIASLQQTLLVRQDELSRYRKVISLVKSPLDAKRPDYSQIFLQLADQKKQPVWLTRINIQSQDVSLYGATTKVDAIPLYVDDLKSANALKRHFDELKIERDEQNSWLINFELLNGKLINE